MGIALQVCEILLQAGAKCVPNVYGFTALDYSLISSFNCTRLLLQAKGGVEFTVSLHMWMIIRTGPFFWMRLNHARSAEFLGCLQLAREANANWTRPDEPAATTSV